MIARLKRVLLLSTLVLSASCSDPTAPEPKVTGNWSGTVGSLALTIQLTQTENAVSGTGSLNGPGGAAAMTATGTFVKPTLSMTLTSPGFSPINVTATLNDDALNGTANGSGFSNAAVTLSR